MVTSIKTAFLASLVSLAGYSLANAQEQALPCGTYQFMEELMKTNPKYAKEFAGYTERIKVAGAANQTLTKQQQVTKIIPVVVHIIYSTPGSNISDAQVYDAIEVLNQDFNKLNADTGDVIPAFSSIASSIGVQFRLAQLDADGNCTNGITRTYSVLSNSAGENVKDLIRWPPNKYLNVWVVRNIASGAGGYSILPCAPASADGIVIRNSQFGTIGTSSPWGLVARSFTHEVGHYLGLPHTWGHSNTPGQAANCSMDDGIADTPNTVGVANGGCNTSASTCGGLNNVQNFMDYSNCPKMFTEGQKAVILDALNLSCRSNLWSPANLMATGTNNGFQISSCKPKVNFESDINRICEGDFIYFTDLSEHFAANPNTSRLWTFDGGTPATSTDSLPVVQYNVPGIYTVSLSVTNAGGTTTVEKQAYVKVIGTSDLLGFPVIESFESPDFPNVPAGPANSWELINSTTNTWHRTGLASADGDYSLRIMHQYIPLGRENTISTPNIDLAGIANPELRFKMAYALTTSTSAGIDKFAINYSVDCGKTWLPLFNASGSDLATAGPENNFVPAAADWAEKAIILPVTAPFATIRFESLSGTGNTLYLDAIRITDGVSSATKPENDLNLSVYPNPGNKNSVIAYNLISAQQTSLILLNAIGQEIYRVDRTESSGNKQHTIFPAGKQLPPGIYVIRLENTQGSYTKKIVLN